MLSARQLSKNIDSLKKVDDSLTSLMYSNLDGLLHFTSLNDSVWAAAVALPDTNKALIPDSAIATVYERTFSVTNDLKNTIQFSSFETEGREKNILLHNVEWHRKYSFSVACLVLFFIGAPLGSIIRKGGMGMPLVVAIVFFLIFHLLNMFGEKFVKENLTSPLVGMWLSVAVLVPVGVFLTYKAMHDSQLFNKEYYTRFAKQVQGLYIRLTSKKDLTQNI